MAKIIDFEERMKEKFESWAREYVSVREGHTFIIEVIIAFLVERMVFTFEDLREELDKSKISLHERYFERARKLLNNTK